MFLKTTACTKPSLRRFWRDEDGGATIEFVLWVPVMMALLLGAFQGALLLTAQGHYGSLARDTARLVARHSITAEEAQAQLEASWSRGGAAPQAQVQVQDGMVRVRITQEASNIVSFNVLGLAEGFDISASVIHAMEPR